MTGLVPRAVPTLFNGIQYKSRMEARFAEMLTSKGLEFVYEKLLPGSAQQYRPDFYISLFDLYVEIKPRAKEHELNIFRADIRECPHPWICLHNPEREKWELVSINRLILPRSLGFFEGVTVEFSTDGVDFTFGAIRLLPKGEHTEAYTADLEPPASEESAGEHFRAVHSFLEGRTP
jgi:hypothetical protein